LFIYLYHLFNKNFNDWKYAAGLVMTNELEWRGRKR